MSLLNTAAAIAGQTVPVTTGSQVPQAPEVATQVVYHETGFAESDPTLVDEFGEEPLPTDAFEGRPPVESQSRAVAVQVTPSPKLAALMKNTTGPMELPFAVFREQWIPEWNQVVGTKLASGTFSTRDQPAKPLGRWLAVRLMSWHYTYVVSPKSSSAKPELAKYSDDGEYCKDGTPVAAYVRQLKAMGFKDAKLDKRMTLICTLIGCENPRKSEQVKGLNQEIISVDLSPSSLTAFQMFERKLAVAIQRGVLHADQPISVDTIYIEAEATSSTVRGSQVDFTKAAFSLLDTTTNDKPFSIPTT